MRTLVLILSATLTVAISSTAQAFCGFYVARADTGLYNQASQVVLVRDGNRTVITMANDFQGDGTGFRGRGAGTNLHRARADQRR